MVNAQGLKPSSSDRNQLIEQHRSFVRALAIDVLKGLPPHIELDELVACGNLGLVEAAERYDPRYLTGFRTFAYYRIRGAMYDALRSLGPLSRADYARARFAAQANDILQTVADDEQASPQSASSGVDDDIASAQAAIDALIPVYLLSLDSEQLPEVADGHANALSQIERDEMVGLARSMIAELSEDDRQIIEAIYFKNLTVSEVGVKLGVSKSWASRLHARAIKRLRELMQRRGLLNAD